MNLKNELSEISISLLRDKTKYAILMYTLKSNISYFIAVTMKSR